MIGRKRKHTIEELEELIMHGERVATRMLAFVELRSKYYNPYTGLVEKLRDIQEILDR